MPKTDNFDRDQRIELLASTVVSESLTIAQAAERLGMPESSAYKLSSEPAYRKSKLARLIERADAIADDAIAGEREAVAALRKLLRSTDENIIATAAKGLLAHAGRASVLLEKQLATANAADRAAKLDVVSDLLDGLLGSHKKTN